MDMTRRQGVPYVHVWHYIHVNIIYSYLFIYVYTYGGGGCISLRVICHGITHTCVYVIHKYIYIKFCLCMHIWRENVDNVMNQFLFSECLKCWLWIRVFFIEIASVKFHKKKNMFCFEQSNLSENDKDFMDLHICKYI